MPRMFTRLFALVLLWIGVTSCLSSYKIVTPVANSVHTSPPPEFKISYASQPSALPPMTLNGVNVESFFTAGAKEATASGTDLAQYLKEGQTRFQIEPPLGPIVFFVYDTTGPEIVILGADANNPTNINGLAVDELGVSSLLVNGIDTTVNDNGSFSANVEAADIYTFDAEDTLAHTSSTKYARYDLLYNPSLRIRTNQSGIDFATRQIVNVLNGMDLSGVISAMGPLYDTTWTGPSGETYGADGFIVGLTLSANSFDLDLGEAGSNTFVGNINVAHIQLQLRLHNGLLPPTVLNIGATAGPIQIGGDLNVSALNHQPVIALENFDLNISNVLLDSVPSIFQPLVSPIVTGILSLFDGLIADAIEDKLAAALPGVFADLIQESYTMTVNQRDMAMVLQLEDLTTANGSLLITLSGGVTPVSINPAIPRPLGPKYTDDALPEPPAGVGDFAVSVNTNVINQTLVAAYYVGLLHLNILDEQIYYGVPRDDNTGGEGAKRLLVNPVTAPYIRIKDVDGSANTTLVINELTLVSQTKKSGVYKTDFSVTVNAKVEITLTVGADNALSVVFVSTPVVDIKRIVLGNGTVLNNVVDEIIETFVVNEIGKVMEQMASPLKGIVLPSFGCSSFTPDTFMALGENNTHAGMAGSLSVISTDCDVSPEPPPKVAYGRGVGTPMTCGANEQYDAGLCYQYCQTGYTGVGPVCWKDNASYGRGVGSVATLTCGTNQDLDAGLCYDKCSTGYHGVGPVCWTDSALSYGRGAGSALSSWCPAGKQQDAGLCYDYCASGYNGVGPVCWSTQPLSYGRGVGTIPNFFPYSCPSGKQMDAGLCYYYCNSGYHGVGPVCWLDNASYGRGVGTAMIFGCGANEDQDAGLCYPKCNTGYSGVGPVCWKDNASYGRGVGTVASLTCGANQDLDAGLCYSQCNSGFHGVGPVCWTNESLSYGRGVGAPIHTCGAGQDLDAGLCYNACADGYHGVGPVCWPN